MNNLKRKNALVDLDNVSLSFGTKEVIKNLTLRIKEPGMYCLYGINGSGKSSLMKIIMGMIRTYSGHVQVMGHSKKGAPRHLISYMPSDLFYYPDSTVRSLICTYAHYYKDFNSEEAVKMCQSFKFELDKMLVQFSKGQRTMISMICTLSRDAKLYLFDEPFGGIDVKVRSEISDLFHRFPIDDKLFIISTHEITDMEHLFSHIILLDDGHVSLFAETEKLKERYGTTVSDTIRRQLYVE